MADDRVEIVTHYNPNPKKQENYTLVCGSHRVSTVVTSTPAVVRNWIFSVRHRHRYHLRNGSLVVGLGVQWNPQSHDVAATLQLCVGRDCLIFQLLFADQSPAVLRRFLADPDVNFVGFSNYRDASLLDDSKHSLEVPRLVELRDAASDLRGCSRYASMETLAAEVLGMYGMEKEERVGRSDWDDAWLSADQVKYASLDAFLAFLVGKELQVWAWVDNSDDDSDNDSDDDDF